ncbi:MAG: flagellar motor protein MotB [Pseudomonadota bacterium]
MPAQSNAPVIIKRKKIIGGDGHHGGAWKVAYADFVTAMMAFFMLMWLLGATTEKQRKGIADYFNPTIPVVRASGGGSGAFGGDSVFSEDALTQNGTGAGLVRPTAERQARGDLGMSADNTQAEAGQETRTETLDDVQRALQGIGGESLISELLRRHIVTRLSDEGLVIELFETPGAPLFDAEGGASPLLRDLIASITPVLDLVVNDLAVQAHTRAIPLVRLDNPTWTQSTARADIARRILLDTGMPAERIARVTGFADRQPVTANPMAERNNRVEIVVLRENT